MSPDPYSFPLCAEINKKPNDHESVAVWADWLDDLGDMRAHGLRYLVSQGREPSLCGCGCGAWFWSISRRETVKSALPFDVPAMWKTPAAAYLQAAHSWTRWKRGLSTNEVKDKQLTTP